MSELSRRVILDSKVYASRVLNDAEQERLELAHQVQDLEARLEERPQDLSQEPEELVQAQELAQQAAASDSAFSRGYGAGMLNAIESLRVRPALADAVLPDPVHHEVDTTQTSKGMGTWANWPSR